MIDTIIEEAKVHSLPEKHQRMQQLEENKEKLLQYLRENIIGSHRECLLKTVYGEKPLVYADYTASGRSLRCIEEYIKEEILPIYANTHTEQSGTGKQSNNAREEARAIIKRVCGANEDDALVFSGTGTTSAVNTLVSKLRIREICESVASLKERTEQDEQVNFCKQNRWGSYDCVLCKTIMRSLGQYKSHARTDFHQRNVQIFKQKQEVWTERPVVFMSVYEHNSNVLPWREAGALIELVPLDSEGSLDFEQLEVLLKKYKDYKSLKVATLTAGNNLSGTIVDVDRAAVLCHRYKTLACFDYAAVIPYIDCNVSGVTPGLVKHHGMKPIAPEDAGLAYKDAVFFSPHKLMGGPGSSGVLIAKKNILFSKQPARAGGGIVLFVDELDHEYVSNVEQLEESGTPGVVQDIRAGLAFQLKEAVGCDTIAEKEESIQKYALQRFRALGDKVYLLGNQSRAKVGIFSFLIRARGQHQAGWRYLPPPFVVSLLNDLFGLQSRSGCLCAGMYGQKALGMDLKLSREFKEALFEGNEVLRPGFVRINLNYFLDQEELQYIMDAVAFVAEYGWMFLPHYQFGPETGIWINREEKESRVRQWLGQIDYSSGEMRYRSHRDLPKHQPTSSFIRRPRDHPLAFYVDEAKQTLVRVLENYKNLYGKSELEQRKLISEPYQRLIWFLFPSDVLPELLSLTKHLTKGGDPLTFESIQKYCEEGRGLGQADEGLPFTPVEWDRGEKRECLLEKEEEKYEAETVKIGKEAIMEQASAQEEDGFLMMDKELSSAEAVASKAQQPLKQDYPEPTVEGKSATVSFTRPKKNQLLKIPKEVLSLVGSAIRDFEMIKDGDRVLVALSGGKDSLCMLHILRHFQSVAPVRFALAAVTVDPMVYEYNPSPLIPYLRDQLGVPYFLERDAIVERAKTCMQKNSICAFCSRMKRGMIYTCARREGYNVIAMGQHLDDLAESFVMSAFHNGCLRTMKANYTIDKGDLRVIRPLVYCREALFKDLSQKVKLPVITDNCPACFSAPKERHRIKLMLAQQENLFPGLFQSILKSILPLMKRNMRDILGVSGGNDSDEEAQEDMLAQDKGGNDTCCAFNP